jgi:hypothetical protein
MSQDTITLKTVADLRTDPESNSPRRFYISAYQRGYRWSTLQVTQLLEDIREFTQRRNPQPDEFYCLQPLVIKVRPNGDLEVVDGQQRLTTLLLILRHFNERLAERFRQPLFSLAYETRPSLDTFLGAPSQEAANENVDFFHLCQAIQAIEAWFARRESEVETIKANLLNNTKVIWFKLAESDNPVDAFTRLNVGKIPLTNDELIRALFLRRAGPDEKEAESAQLRIAHEWDLMEKGLQSDDFWYFLSNQPGKEQNRIGFLFDLVARSENLLSDALAEDAYGLFYAFNQQLKQKDATTESEWRKIKQAYLMLEEWFEDRTLYHMVGFLVSQEMPVNKIREMSQGCLKSAFEQRLRSEIYRRAIGAELPNPPDKPVISEDVAERLDQLTYHSKGENLRAILLLFNLVTLLQNDQSNLRFQFDSFKQQHWDIEHVRSVTDDKPERFHLRKAWLENCLGYLQSQDFDDDLCAEIERFMALTQVEATDEQFDPLYEKLLQRFQEDREGEAVHHIGNLTLLDERTNRSYKNAVFAIKRHRLLELDQHGTFVPLCTRNVFLKCYSPQVDNVMFWSETDQNGYQETIAQTLVNFFCDREETTP